MKRRTKIATILTTGLLSAALVGVGFAAWNIAQNQSVDATTQQGSIGVDAVVNHSGLPDGAITISAQPGEIKLLGKNTAGSGENHWLTYTGEEYETLTTTFTITVVSDAVKTIDLKLDITDTAGTDWANAVAANYVVTPTLTGSGDAGSMTDGKTINVTTTGTFTVTVTFAWGEKLAGGPLEYFSQKEYSAENATEAENALEAIGKLDGVKFTVTATAKPAS